MTFKPGQSGNPKGRPQGSRNKASLAADTLLGGESETITRKAIELAKAGDGSALRLCMDRICPPRKDRHIQFTMPTLNKPADAVKAMSAIVAAVARGDLTPSEAGELSDLVENFAGVFEAADLAARVAKLEGKQPK